MKNTVSKTGCAKSIVERIQQKLVKSSQTFWPYLISIYLGTADESLAYSDWVSRLSVKGSDDIEFAMDSFHNFVFNRNL